MGRGGGTQECVGRGDIRDQIHPHAAMVEFLTWLTCDEWVGSDIVCMCYPAGFDYPWVSYYMHKFLGDDHPFSFACIDIKSVLMVQGRNGYCRATAGLPINHVAGS